MAKVGDTVRFLNQTGGGKIIRIKDNLAWVDDDGFETPVLLRECVVVRTAEQDLEVERMARREDPKTTTVAPKQAPAVQSEKFDNDADESEEDEDEIIDEIPGGDKINITLGFEPADRKRLSESNFDASLINDSNYYLYFALSSQSDVEEAWTSRYAGMVEPNTELWLGTFVRSEVVKFDSLMLQYIAFKKSKPFENKQPQSIRIKVDTTKFFKLHCFTDNRYFENEVLAFDFVKDDIPVDFRKLDVSSLLSAKQGIGTNNSSVSLSIEGNTKVHGGRNNRGIQHPVPDYKNKNGKTTNAPKRRPEFDLTEPLVIDLHINSLVDNTRGMSSADMLNLQVDTFRKIMDENLRNFGRKIIFIHGKGEGVLRQALTKELNHRYRGHEVQDASFQEYGYGATQVTIRQYPNKFNKTPR